MIKDALLNLIFKKKKKVLVGNQKVGAALAVVFMRWQSSKSWDRVRRWEWKTRVKSRITVLSFVQVDLGRFGESYGINL